MRSQRWVHDVFGGQRLGRVVAHGIKLSAAPRGPCYTSGGQHPGDGSGDLLVDDWYRVL